MNSQPKEEQAQKGKSMQECRTEEGHVVGHLVMGQAWKHWAVEFLGLKGEAEQTSEANACFYAETRPRVHCNPDHTLLLCGPCSGQPVLASGGGNPLNDN